MTGQESHFKAHLNSSAETKQKKKVPQIQLSDSPFYDPAALAMHIVAIVTRIFHLKVQRQKQTLDTLA